MSFEAQNESPNQLTVLQVLPALKLGGVERGTVEFAIYLKQHGHQPIVVSAGGPMVEELVAQQIKHITLNVGKKSLSSIRCIKKLQHIITKHQVNVVHARSRLPAWLCYWAIKRIKQSAKPKFVTTLHGLHSVNRYASIMARGDAVIAVSKTAEQYLNDHFSKHLTAEPELIYRGIDPQFDFQHQVDPNWYKSFQQKLYDNTGDDQAFKKVLLPGRLSRIKGVEHLITWLESTSHSCKLLFTAKPNDSKFSKKIQQLFAHHRLSDKIIWLGIERKMPDLYASVDLVVSVNNKAESFGRTVLEALSVGTPVAAFAQGGVAEVMTALYPEGQVTAGDDEELSKRIDAILSNPPPVKTHNQFSNQQMFEKTLAVYQKMMASHSETAHIQ